MSDHIPKSLVARVRRRANEICEFCRLPQWTQEATFHIDHIHPLADGGMTTFKNLALACVTCSLKKASRTHGRDPKTKRLVRLYHPRRDRWMTHFRWTRTWRIVGKTPNGRATLRAMGMNRPAVVLIRQTWARLGMFPQDRRQDPE